MADKKITELTEYTTPKQSDLLVIVSDPSGTPITKKISLKTVLNGVNFITDSTTPATSVVKSILTANVAATATANTLISGEFVTNALSTSSNTEYQYGIVAKSVLSGNTANVKIEHAAAKFTLDVGNAAVLITNTYGAVLYVANTGARTQNVQAFIGFGDALGSGANTTVQTKYLFDIGLNGTANVIANTSAGANANVLVSNCAATKTANHMIRIRVNGADMWLLASNVAPA